MLRPHAFLVPAAVLLFTASSSISCSTPRATNVPDLAPGPQYLTRNHDLLERMEGTFDLVGWSQREPYGLRLDFAGTATGRLVLDGLFLELTIAGRLGDEDYTSVAWLGYDTTGARYELSSVSSWGSAINGPATGQFDPEAQALSLRLDSSPTGGGASRGGSDVFTLVDANAWTLERFVFEWEPRLWSTFSATRRGRSPAAPDPGADAANAIQAGAVESESER